MTSLKVGSRVLVVLVALAGPLRADVIDRIMAVVGGQPITLSDVTAVLQFHLVEPPQGTRDPLVFAMDRLVDRTLMLAEVDRFQPPEPDPVEITVRVDQLERTAGSTAAFEKSLQVTGSTRDRLRRYIRDDLRISTYMNQRFGAVVTPAGRDAAVAAWLAELRRRAEITVPYQAK
jgi:parvulin-like peptidyl-prolyl isomerase